MQTEIAKRSLELIPEIIQRLDSGEVLVLPMETLYAIAAHAFRPAAIAQIAQLKRWEAPQPLALLTRKEKAGEFGVINPACAKLMAHFPYPVTALVPVRETVPEAVTGGSKSLMMVCPDEFIYELVGAAPFAIAVTSAKLPPDLIARNFEAAYQLFKGQVSLIVDGGQCQYGQSGTMIDFTVPVPTILHYGPIAVDELKAIVPEIELPSHLRK